MVRHIKLLSVFALCVISILFGVVLGGGLESRSRQHLQVPKPSAHTLPLGGARAMAAGLDGLPMSFADIAERVNPAVVYVQVTEVGRRSEQGGPEANPFGPNGPHDFWRFFQQQQPNQDQDDEFRREGAGSGVIIDPSGWILTNNHVIQGATKVTVKLADDREFKAEVKGSDDLLDVALLKIETQGELPVASLGDSDALRVGDWVMAIGNPFVYEHTVTVGVVSHKGRSSGNPFQQFIQTDAAINFGNSGGPLLNTRGEVVGINTAISSVGQGIGFAIPINRVRDIMEVLKTKGHVARGFLGVNPQGIDDRLLESFPGLPSHDGALVVDVEADSPAEKAGLQIDDVIIGVDGKPVKTREDLFHIVGAISPGTSVSLKVLREDKKGSARWAEKTVSVRLAERKPENAVGGAPEERGPGGEKKELPGKKLGLQVDDLTPQAREAMKLTDKVRGCMVVHVTASGAAADAGIESGDVIAEVNGQPVENVARFGEVVNGLKAGAPIRVRLYHLGAPRYVTLTPPK